MASPGAVPGLTTTHLKASGKWDTRLGVSSVTHTSVLTVQALGRGNAWLGHGFLCPNPSSAVTKDVLLQ
jgi:hypothetical protein